MNDNNVKEMLLQNKQLTETLTGAIFAYQKTISHIITETNSKCDCDPTDSLFILNNDISDICTVLLKDTNKLLDLHEEGNIDIIKCIYSELRKISGIVSRTKEEIIKNTIYNFFKDREVDYTIIKMSSLFVYLKIDTLHLIYYIGETSVSSFIDNTHPHYGLINELLKVLTPDDSPEPATLSDGKKFTRSILLTGNEKMKDEFFYRSPAIQNGGILNTVKKKICISN